MIASMEISDKDLQAVAEMHVKIGFYQLTDSEFIGHLPLTTGRVMNLSTLTTEQRAIINTIMITMKPENK